MSKKVLVADDSSTMRKIILRSLQAVGVTDTVEAADGEEAVNMFGQGTFDLTYPPTYLPTNLPTYLPKKNKSLYVN